MLKYVVTILLFCSLAVADDPPKPPPVPVVTPAATEIKIIVPKGVLGEGKRLSPYVFDTTTKCYLTMNAAATDVLNGLSWDLEDGPPDAETMGDRGKTVVFSLANPGLYQVYAQWNEGHSKIWFEIKPSTGPPIVDPTVPVIPPGPIAPPPPVDDPGASVVPTGFRVMFVYETADKLTSAQSVTLGSTRIRKYLDSKCVKGTTGQFSGLPEYRFWDKDGKDASKDSDTIKAMWAGVKPKLGTLPQVAIHADGKGHLFPLPATEDATLTLLQMYGGK